MVRRYISVVSIRSLTPSLWRIAGQPRPARVAQWVPMPQPVVMWFRRDLRLRDNPALLAAAADGAGVLPLFVMDPALWRPAGPTRRAYLLRSLAALDADLRGRGGRLVVRHGDPVEVLPRV